MSLKTFTDLIKRQEHVDKGTPKDTIDADFSVLVRAAIDQGVLDQTVKGVAKSVHKLGLPFIKNTVTRIEEAIAANYDPAVEPSNAPEQMSLGQLLASCKTLSALIRSEEERLGLESDRHGIERRGAEVHISLASPAAAAAPTAGTEVSAAGR